MKKSTVVDFFIVCQSIRTSGFGRLVAFLGSFLTVSFLGVAPGSFLA
jgi:hypothetical protein